MSQPTLYLMLGFPGAGKTTAAKIIHQLTGAVHLWADQERWHKYGAPSYSHAENLELYDDLNKKAERLLREGNSVVYDTNFNFYKDRELLRSIAAKYDAQTKLIWVTTDKATAKHRATENAHLQGTRVLGNMPPENFDRMSHNLQPPQENEAYTELDGTKMTPRYVADQLGIDA